MSLNTQFKTPEEIIEEELKNFRKLKRFLSIKEVAEFFCVSEKTVRRWIQSGKLIAISGDKNWKIPRLAIIEFAKQNSNLN